MHFSHVVEINDPSRAELSPLSREQLWRGLLRRVERPMEFLPRLRGCLIVMRGDATFVRELEFDAFTVRDRVRLEAQLGMRFETEASEHVPKGKLHIEIEEPNPNRLRLRFTYAVERERTVHPTAEAQYDRLLQSVYVQTDIESVAIIRRIAANEFA